VVKKKKKRNRGVNMDIAKMIASHMFNDSTKQKVIDGLNKNINIPIINEETEEKVLTAIYEVIEDVMKDVLGAK
jgi:broad specificity polyphosphatase/5'/3'-nucleotidase SurE